MTAKTLSFVCLYGVCAMVFFPVDWAGEAVAVELKIMPLGDSITEGVGGQSGYRQPLYDLLKTAGYDTQFVGSLTVNPGTLPVNQQAHEGHSGFVISAGAGRPGLADTGNIDAWLGPIGADPEIILLMIGTNDIILNNQIATAPDRLSSLISKISNKTTGLKPNAKLIVGQIVPSYESVTQGSRTRAYNTGVADVVLNHQTLGENVSLVDMYFALNPTTDLADGLHPNDAGYAKMANVWFQGIKVVTPEPSTMILTLTGALSALLIVWQRHTC